MSAGEKAIVDEVAKAICKAVLGNLYGWQKWKPAADAAIRAMRRAENQ